MKNLNQLRTIFELAEGAGIKHNDECLQCDEASVREQMCAIGGRLDKSYGDANKEYTEAKEYFDLLDTFAATLPEVDVPHDFPYEADPLPVEQPREEEYFESKENIELAKAWRCDPCYDLADEGDTTSQLAAFERDMKEFWKTRRAHDFRQLELRRAAYRYARAEMMLEIRSRIHAREGTKS